MDEDLRFDRIVASPKFQENISNSKYEWARGFVTSKYGVAIIIGILTLVLLVTAQPPFVLNKPESPFEDATINWWYVCVLVLITCALVLIIPPVHSYCGKAFTSPPQTFTPK